MINKDKQQEDLMRLARARKTIADNPETQLIEASAAGDAITVKRLLEHVYDLPRNRIKDKNFILLRDEAYNLAFNTAAKKLNCDVIKHLIDYSAHKISPSNITQTLYRASIIDPDKNPDAEDIMNIILDRKPNDIPKPLLEIANRLRTAYKEDIDRANHIRENFSQFLDFYMAKEETIAKAEKQNKAPEKINSPFKLEDKSKKKKKRPSYIKPV